MRRGKLKFVHNMGANRGIVSTEFGVTSHKTAILEVEKWQKVDKFEPVHLGKLRNL